MIEIHLGEEFKIPSVFLSHEGTITLRFPVDMKIEDALSHCQDELIQNFREVFCKLFGDREFPREFQMVDSRIIIRPRSSVNLLNS